MKLNLEVRKAVRGRRGGEGGEHCTLPLHMCVCVCLCACVSVCVCVSVPTSRLALICAVPCLNLQASLRQAAQSNGHHCSECRMECHDIQLLHPPPHPLVFTVAIYSCLHIPLLPRPNSHALFLFLFLFLFLSFPSPLPFLSSTSLPLLSSC